MTTDRLQTTNEEQGFDRPDDVLEPGESYASIDEKIGDIVLRQPLQRGWVFGLLVSFAFIMLLFYAVTWLLIKGVGIWGINIPVGWGFAIANYVWWIGIGFAGTVISSTLLLLRQKWRTSINRFAEAMTLFAIACAGLFPLLHLGRPWVFYWLMPYPNTMALWPQFRSPLVWDFFALTAYLTVSLLFWYQGLIPDVAAMRDRATNPLTHLFYGALALGWRGSAIHWKYYETSYWLLASLATPLVVSVHSIVGLDFAAAIVPGWHSTIFPPLLRRRGDPLRLCDGADARHPAPPILSSGGVCHPAPSGEHGQDHPGSQSGRRLRLCPRRFSWPGTAATCSSGSRCKTAPSGTTVSPTGP